MLVLSRKSEEKIIIGEENQIVITILKIQGDKVSIREKSKSLIAIEDSLASSSAVYEWLSWNSDKKEGTFVKTPQRLQIPENIKEQLIVELYSK